MGNINSYRPSCAWHNCENVGVGAAFHNQKHRWCKPKEVQPKLNAFYSFYFSKGGKNCRITCRSACYIVYNSNFKNTKLSTIQHHPDRLSWSLLFVLLLLFLCGRWTDIKLNIIMFTLCFNYLFIYLFNVKMLTILAINNTIVSLWSGANHSLINPVNNN